MKWALVYLALLILLALAACGPRQYIPPEISNYQQHMEWGVEIPGGPPPP